MNFILAAKLPLYLYPFLNTKDKEKPHEYLRLTSLGVIGTLVKVDFCDPLLSWILFYFSYSSAVNGDIMYFLIRALWDLSILPRDVVAKLICNFWTLSFCAVWRSGSYPFPTSDWNISLLPNQHGGGLRLVQTSKRLKSQ